MITGSKKTKLFTTRELKEHLSGSFTKSEVYRLLTLLRANKLAERVTIIPNAKGRRGRPAVVWRLPIWLKIELVKRPIPKKLT